MTTDYEDITINMGDQAQAFFNSEVGKYVLNRCNQEIQANMDKLTKVDPDNGRKVREYQNSVRIARMLPEHINELIGDRNQLLRQMELEDDA